MRNIWVIAKREFNLYFISPIAYLVFFVTLLTIGGLLYLDIVFAAQTQQFVPNIQRSFQLLIFPIFFLAIPALTMRTVSEENRSGTLELLLTAPVADWHLVVGKWLGAFMLFLLLTLITWIYPVILNQLISPGIDQGILLSGYLGVVLISATLCGIGVMTSSFFSNQIAAFFAAIGIIIVFWVIGSPAQILSGTAADVFRYLSLTEHFYNNLLVGVVRLDDVLFYLSFTALCLFLGSISVETRRWR